MEENRISTVKCLQGLFFLQLVGCVVSMLTGLPEVSGVFFQWIQRGILLCVTICLCLLPGRYRLSGIARALLLVCNIMPLVLHAILRIEVQQFITINTTLGYVGTGLGMVAVILECTAHAATVPAVKREWTVYGICVVVLNLAMAVSHQALVNVMNEVIKHGNDWLLTLYNVLAQTVNLAIRIVYLILLWRTIGPIMKEEHTYG